MEYTPRIWERKFGNLNNTFRVVLVTGARQVGKTTMLRHLAEGTNRKYVTLDDPFARELAQEDPIGFFQAYEPPVLIDEVQYAPQLFPAIKLIADQEGTNGLFWLTGSQHYSMMQHVQESLAGRVGIMRMYGFTQSEKARIPYAPLQWDLASLQKRAETRKEILGPSSVWKGIWLGNMPAVQDFASNPEARETYFSSYLASYLLRDVSQLGGVLDNGRFTEFLRACAALTGQQVNYTRLAETVGISTPTAKQWLELLAGLGIVTLLEPFSSNALKRLAKTRKLYFTDTGFAAWLGAWPTEETLERGAASGAFFENAAVMEIQMNLEAGPEPFQLSYYRDSNKTEIDLLVRQEISYHPLEIKQSAKPPRQQIRKFDALDRNGIARGLGGIVCMAPEPAFIDARDVYIPSWVL